MEQKTTAFLVRLTSEEFEAFAELARLTGLNKSSAVRLAVCLTTGAVQGAKAMPEAEKEVADNESE